MSIFFKCRNPDPKKNKAREETGGLIKGTNSPEHDTKEMEIYELPDKEFKIIILRKLKYYKTTQIDN